MYPDNCEGCYTYREIQEKNNSPDKKTESRCIARLVRTCPCSTCITKVNCCVKLRCLDYIISCIKYIPNEYEVTDIMRWVPKDLHKIIKNAL